MIKRSFSPTCSTFFTSPLWKSLHQKEQEIAPGSESIMVGFTDQETLDRLLFPHWSYWLVVCSNNCHWVENWNISSPWLTCIYYLSFTTYWFLKNSNSFFNIENFSLSPYSTMFLLPIDWEQILQKLLWIQLTVVCLHLCFIPDKSILQLWRLCYIYLQDTSSVWWHTHPYSPGRNSLPLE